MAASEALASGDEESLEITASQPARTRTRLKDLLELTKPRITTMVVLTTVVGFVMGSTGEPAFFRLVMTLLGTYLLASGASALNMLVERDADARMTRTRERPLPSGRVEAETALAFGVGLAILGAACLYLLVGPLAGGLGVVTLLSYLAIYTPLKRITPLATVIGAVPGALPPLIGWAAARNDLSLGGWALFAILFFWQLPHFYAIAWMYREDYQRGGFAMLPVVDADGRRTARQTVAYTLGLVLASFVPVMLGTGGNLYAVIAAAAGLGFGTYAVRFAGQRTRETARHLMLVSIVYLPVVLAVLVVDRL